MRPRGGLNGANRVETFSGSQFRDPLGEPYNGSVKLNVPPGGPYTIYARTLEDNGTSSGGLYSAFRYSNTTINSNTMDPNALTQEFDNLATVASITAGNTVDLGTVGFLGCWIPVTSSDVDIEMTASTAPATATLGGDIAVTSSFTNQGSAASEPFEVGFYFSGDATIDTDDAFTGFTCTIGGLGVGASDSCDGTVPVPAVAPGTYFVGALADIHNVVHENNELNIHRLKGGGLRFGVGASDSCDGTVPVPAVAPGTYFVGALADIHNVVHENNELNIHRLKGGGLRFD